MKHQRLLSPILAGLGALLCVLAAPAAAAPLHPDLLRRLSADELAALPPEPSRAPAVDGLQAAAVREGRAWTGHPALLVLMVDFDDRPADRTTHDAAYFERFLFSLDEMEFGSLREYYLETSYETMDVTGAVFGWYRMPRDYSTYTGGASGLCRTCYQANARYLAADAVRAAVDAGVDFTLYDNDGPDGVASSGDDDGILDGLMIVYSGIGAERSGSLEDFRSHYWDMVAMDVVDGIKVPDYVIVPEEENLGVAVHEYGHALGGEDLYDLTNRGAGLGYFSVMAANMWFNNARSPGGPDPYTRTLWGFVEPEVIRADEPAWALPRVNESPAVLRLWTKGEPGREYFLVENRAPVGVDRFLPGEGLLVYHVDENVPRQDDANRYRVGVVQADGLKSLQGQAPRNMGEPGDFFPGTHGVRELDDDTSPDTGAHDGSATQVALRDIGDPADPMTLSLEVGVFVGGAPGPVLETVSAGGYFAPLPADGNRVKVRLQVHNRGSRLSPGRLQVFTRDPGIIRFEGFESDLPGIGPLGDHRLDEDLLIDLAPGALESARPVFLEAVLETAGESYALSTALVTEGTVIMREGFETDAHAVASGSLKPAGPNPWQRLTGRTSEGTWAYGTLAGYESYGPRTDAVLMLGPYFLAGPAELRFRHYVSTQAFGEYGQEGGFLEASTDGGATWTALTPEGGYPTVFDLTDGNPYPDQPAWAGVREVWEEERVPISDLRGETLFRFHFVSDYSGAGLLYRGWYVDEVLLRGWDRCYSGVFDAPRHEAGRLRVGFSVLSLLEEGPAVGVRLVRERGSRVTELGSWPVTGRLDVSMAVEEPPAGWSDRFWLEWEDGTERTGPLVVESPGGVSGPLFEGTPALFRAAAPGAIRYRVPGDAGRPVVLDLFDVRGARVRRLVEGLRPPGSHDLPWPARSDHGRAIASGVYFLRLRVADRYENRRVVQIP